jgi:hypothetical protein
VDKTRSELEKIVARLLPGIVAEQLAAMNGEQVEDAVPPGAARTADWYLDANAAIADFENQLAHIEFSPEGRGVTSDMRRYHWIAIDSRDRAVAILANAGRRDKSKDVYAALGRGREALIRLRALLEGRPIPLQLLSPEELRTPYDAAQSPHTDERFHWKGKGTLEFPIDRPRAERRALIESVYGKGSGMLREMVRTQDVIRQVDRAYVSETPHVQVVQPEVTHLKFDGAADSEWSVRVVDPEQLPELLDLTRGVGHGLYRHRLGHTKVFLQSLKEILVIFYPADLTPERLADFDGETRTTIELPKAEGVLWVKTKGSWSIELASPGRRR